MRATTCTPGSITCHDCHVAHCPYHDPLHRTDEYFRLHPEHAG